MPPIDDLPDTRPAGTTRKLTNRIHNIKAELTARISRRSTLPNEQPDGRLTLTPEQVADVRWVLSVFRNDSWSTAEMSVVQPVAKDLFETFGLGE